MPIDPWYTLLLAWLHDPVDKAADIRGHVARARRYARAVMGDEIAEADLGGTPDHLASAYERLPMPGKNSGAPYVGPDQDGWLLMYHPLSAERRRVAVGFDDEAAAAKLGRLVPPDMPAEQRFLTLWRCAPEEFPETPADTRCPDHSLWQHLDTTAAIAWAIRGGKGATALLSFKISPVQPFIEASRSLRDLLSGSYLLSWLCFSAMGSGAGSVRADGAGVSRATRHPVDGLVAAAARRRCQSGRDETGPCVASESVSRNRSAGRCRNSRRPSARSRASGVESGGERCPGGTEAKVRRRVSGLGPARSE